MATRSNQTKSTKKKTAARKTRERKSPPPELFDFCDGVTEPDGKKAKFTDKEKQFVCAYLTDAKFEATKAAQIAGYDASNQNSLRVIACQLMKRHRVREAINAGLEALTFPKFEALFRVAEIAKNTIADVIGDDGGFDAEKALENGAIHNINSIEITERILAVTREPAEKPDDYDDDESEVFEKSVTERKIKVKMYSKLTALKILTDVSFAKKHELTGKDGKDLPAAAANVLILPDNGRGDSPDAIKERAKSQAGKKKTG